MMNRDARLEAGRRIAELYANMPDPERREDQQEALAALLELKQERLRLADAAGALADRQHQAAKRAYKLGLSRPMIAETLGVSVQTIHNWVNPPKPDHAKLDGIGAPE